MPDSVAVVGGGYAGMACAMTLAEAGVATVVFEAGRVLGGRSRRVESHGVALDNGQHLLIGAYGELLRLADRAHGGLDDLFLRQPLELLIDRGVRLRLPALPPPLNGLVGLLTAAGLSWRDKWAAAGLLQWLKKHAFRLPADEALGIWLARRGQSRALVAALWEPLCLAALNTPVAVASAQVFANVLRDSLLGPAGASDMILPRVDLSRFFPEAAGRFIEARQGMVRPGCRVGDLRRDTGGWRVGDQTFDAAVIAVGPQHAERLLRPHDARAADTVAALEYQPITTVWLQYPSPTRLKRPMLGFNGKITQWLFDRSRFTGQVGLLAAVISTDGPHLDMSHDRLGEAVALELAQHFGWSLPPEWIQVIIEKRATFACRHDTRRPERRTRAPGLWLAGDYVAGDYPATVEGAVRCGVAVARDILEKGKR